MELLYLIFPRNQIQNTLEQQGGPKAVTPTLRLIPAVLLILADMCPFYQLFEDFSKSK